MNPPAWFSSSLFLSPPLSSPFYTFCPSLSLLPLPLSLPSLFPPYIFSVPSPPLLSLTLPSLLIFISFLFPFLLGTRTQNPRPLQCSPIQSGAIQCNLVRSPIHTHGPSNPLRPTSPLVVIYL